jgi:hypothetical protein
MRKLFSVVFISLTSFLTCHAAEIVPSAAFTIKSLDESHRIVTEKDIWKREYIFNKTNGTKTYNDAFHKCKHLKVTVLRMKATHCFKEAVDIVGTPIPGTELVETVRRLLIDAGVYEGKEWHYIENKLTWSHYYFEMADYYWKLIMDQGEDPECQS